VGVSVRAPAARGARRHVREFHLADPPGIEAVLGIPEESEICVTMPLGWPGRPFGPLSRRPLDEVVHDDRW
jgi:hypothetical protein